LGRAEKSQQCHQYLFQYRTFASERHQVQTWGRQTCFLSRAPSNVATPLRVVDLTTNPKLTLPGHKPLMGTNFRKDISHETVKFCFKVISPLKPITSPDKYFLFLWNNAYAFLGSHYWIPKQWPMGPLQLNLPPLTETSSYATDQHGTCTQRPCACTDILQILRIIVNRTAMSYFLQQLQQKMVSANFAVTRGGSKWGDRLPQGCQTYGPLAKTGPLRG